MNQPLWTDAFNLISLTTQKMYKSSAYNIRDDKRIKNSNSIEESDKSCIFLEVLYHWFKIPNSLQKRNYSQQV